MELVVAAILTFAVDQAGKRFVLKRFAKGQVSSSALLVRIRRITNPNMGFGFIRNRHILLALWVLLVLSTVLVIYSGRFFVSHVARLGLGLALGGATGNLWDVMRRQGVVDFIDLRFWPVFNLADVAIVLGAASALWFAW